ncbi:MAG: DUF1080 domain-containing protein, partial [Bacteroidetes bacterium]
FGLAPAPEPAPGRKRKRRRGQVETPPPPPPPPPAVRTQPGTGILFNDNDDTRRDNLVTTWEHGDLLLDLEVMIPKGSNSGIYLQGLYEVQLLDSWGVKEPGFGDIGGIYRNWSNEPGNIYRGKPPLTNAAKAPGTWQHMRIAFRAPRFDAAGNKTEHARFVYVELNGVRIHENLEVPLPTGGPISAEEVARGPLMIQGDHGPVAFRNIRYQHMRSRKVTVSNLTYAYYPGAFTDRLDLNGLTPARTGRLKDITATLMPEEAPGRMVFSGTLEVAEAGTYPLMIRCDGTLSLEVGSQRFEGDAWRVQEVLAECQLPAGATPFRLVYARENRQSPPNLGIFNVSSFPESLHAPGAYTPRPWGASPFTIKVGNKPRLSRSFFDYQGDRQQRLPYTLAVGTPAGVHYFYDLQTGTPVCVWRGDFLDATPMWRGRGNGTSRPLGAPQYLPTSLGLARMDSSRGELVFFAKADRRSLGYRLEQGSHLPIFRAEVADMIVTDLIAPSAEGKALRRTLSIEALPAGSGLYLRLAEGEQIQEVAPGLFAVDQTYFIKVPAGQSLQQQAGPGNRQMLLAPVTPEGVSYEILW